MYSHASGTSRSNGRAAAKVAPPPAEVAPADAWLPTPGELPSHRGSAAESERGPAPVAGPNRLRVVIADSDPLARRVVRDVFERTPGFVVAAEADSGIQAIELALHYRPDVVLIEAVLPGVGGIEAVRRITERAPEVRLVVFSVSEEPELALAALRAGASGFLSKHVPIEAVARTLRGVARGEAAISRALTLRLVERLRSTSANGSGMRPVRSSLTTREWEILDLMTTGASTREITDELVLSEETVYSHVKSILRKLDVHTRDDAIASADRLRHPGLS